METQCWTVSDTVNIKLVEMPKMTEGHTVFFRHADPVGQRKRYDWDNLNDDGQDTV